MRSKRRLLLRIFLELLENPQGKGLKFNVFLKGDRWGTFVALFRCVRSVVHSEEVSENLSLVHARRNMETTRLASSGLCGLRLLQDRVEIELTLIGLNGEQGVARRRGL